MALSRDSAMVCYDRQERWVNSGGQKNVPPECRINGSQVFCMRFKAELNALKSDDTAKFRFVATLHTPQPPIRCLHCTHLRDVNARACLTLVCCTVSAEAITLSWLQKIRSQTLSTAAESTAR